MKPRELLTYQPHHCTGDKHGADPPGIYTTIHGRVGGDWG